MFDYIEKLWPIFLAIVCYIVRIEVNMAKIIKDLCWIKKALENLAK